MSIYIYVRVREDNMHVYNELLSLWYGNRITAHTTAHPWTTTLEQEAIIASD